MTRPRDLTTRIAYEFLADKDGPVESAGIQPLIDQIGALLNDAPVETVPGRDDELLFARVMNSIVHAASAPLDQWVEERAGTAVRSVWDDRTFLIKCVAGTPFPGHAHDREERLVILDGDLRFGAERFSTGACIVSALGSTHEPGEALADCLLLIQYGR